MYELDYYVTRPETRIFEKLRNGRVNLIIKSGKNRPETTGKINKQTSPRDWSETETRQESSLSQSK